MTAHPTVPATMCEDLTQSVRRLIEAVIMTDVDEATIHTVRSLVDGASELLEGTRVSGDSFGLRHTADDAPAVWGNVVIGVRNAMAPPLVIERDNNGRVTTECRLGPGYEGPPGHVHGGICALILDHVLGATAHRPGLPAVTATLTIRYRRPTRLGRLRAEGWVHREEGAKTFATGHIADDDGITVEAEGVFIRIDPERKR